MTTILRGTILHAPALGELEALEGGYLVLEDGVIQGLYPALPAAYRSAPVEDYGEDLILQSFADMHLHAPQYAMAGMGMDLPLLEWLDTYTFPAEARYADLEYARRVYRRLAADLIAWGTTRVAMFATLHTDATLILMEELERSGVTGYVGKVNMDRNGGKNLQETTEESMAETERWLAGCHFPHIKPILTPRFTPSCTDELMDWLGRTGAERGLYVQSHLSESLGEVAWVRELCPDCGEYWETYARHGLWKDHTIMAHCVHSSEGEQRAMAEAGVLAVHCADSNWNLCSGTAPVRQMLDRGVWVALGSDIAGGAQLGMPQVITASIRASKVKYMETGAAFLTAAEGYYLGTTAGHRYFGAGAGFAAGDRLHAVVVDESRFPEPVRPLSSGERLERALYRMDPRDIRAVYSEGRKVLG